MVAYGHGLYLTLRVTERIMVRRYHFKHLRGSLCLTVSIVHAKNHLSELITKTTYNRERFIITRRNKPVAALVSLEDLQIIEQHQEKQGLWAIAGKWEGFEDVAENLQDLTALRETQITS